MPATAYDVQAVTGGPYSLNPSATTTDSDGDAIALSLPYTMFVWSVSDGTSANIDSLASAATDVTLEIVAASVNGPDIVGSDIDDNGNGLDLSVTFNAASNETGILAYRVIAVKDASASGFTINNALALPSTAWMFINPDGSPSYTTVFEAIKTDSDGDLIVENQPYTIFVVSFANTQQASISTMSFSQQDVTLISYVGLNEATLDQIAAIVQEGQIEIQLPEALLGTGLNADLVNLSGQVVGSKSLNNAQNFINTEELVNGIYFVHLKDGENSIKSIKVIIQ